MIPMSGPTDERKLKKLFDYQRFENDPALSKLIAETEARRGASLGDDDLDGVSAAGDVSSAKREKGKKQK